MILKDWNIVHENPLLKGDEIHTWLCNLKVDKKNIPVLSKNLSSEELKKADNFHFEKDKNSYIISHSCLRLTLSKYLNIKPTTIKFKENKYGKPFLHKEINKDLRFNLSHSGDFCLIGITLNDKIGVDIEKIKPEFSSLEIAEKYFSKKEFTELSCLPEPKITEAFFTFWTRKEAFIKAVGNGLSIDLKSFDVTLSPTKPEITRIENQSNISNWHLYNLPINENYFAAIALYGKEKSIRKYYFNI